MACVLGVRDEGVKAPEVGRIMTKGAYCVRADSGRYAKAFKDGGYAAIGWEETGDLSRIPRDDAEALGAAYDVAYPNDGKRRRDLNLGQIGRFIWGIRPGDVVVTPMEQPKFLLVGVVSSPYYYEITTGCPYGHRREIRWLDEPILRSSLSVPIQHVLRAPLTAFRVRPPEELFQAAGEPVPTPELVARAEKEASAAVLGRLLELDPDEFEILVTELLTTLGFEAENTGKSGDGGVDVQGRLTVHNFTAVDLHVQVKRYKLGNTVDRRTVKEFRASVPDKAQAAFVTTSGYTKKAREEAEREGFRRIGLIDGEQLVDILAEEYDRLPAEVREKLGLRRVLVAD
jgi:restriction system protein